VREVCELLMHAQGSYERVMAQFWFDKEQSCVKEPHTAGS
jgi:hypothetical protein